MTTITGRVRGAALTLFVSLWLCQGGGRCEEPWRAEFDATCARTSEAMTLSVAELNQLIQRCSALQKVIEVQEESVRKVYLKRLQLCRNLYDYVLEYRKNEKPSP